MAPSTPGPPPGYRHIFSHPFPRVIEPYWQRAVPATGQPPQFHRSHSRPLPATETTPLLSKPPLGSGTGLTVPYGDASPHEQGLPQKDIKGELSKLCYNSMKFVGGHTVAALAFYPNAEYFTPTGYVRPSGRESFFFPEVFRNIFSQELFAGLAVTAQAVFDALGYRIFAARGETPPGGPPNWAAFRRNAAAYLGAGPMAEIPTGLINRLFPRSGMVGAVSGLRAVPINFLNGMAHGLIFAAVYAALRAAIYHFWPPPPGPNAGTSQGDNAPKQAEAAGLRELMARYLLPFVFGCGVQAAAWPVLAAHNPMSGMADATTGAPQLWHDVRGQFLLLLVSFCCGSVPAFFLGLLLDQWLRRRQLASAQVVPA